MDVNIMRSELMKFSKEELVTELLAALIELAKPRSPGTKGGPTEAEPNRPHCKPDQSCCDFICGN